MAMPHPERLAHRYSGVGSCVSRRWRLGTMLRRLSCVEVGPGNDPFYIFAGQAEVHEFAVTHGPKQLSLPRAVTPGTKLLHKTSENCTCAHLGAPGPGRGF